MPRGEEGEQECIEDVDTDNNTLASINMDDVDTDNIIQENIKMIICCLCNYLLNTNCQL